MPWHLQFDPAKDLFRITGTGRLTDDDLRQGVPEMLAHPRFVTARAIHDYTAVTEWALSAVVLHAFAEAVKSRNVSGRRAFLSRHGIAGGFTQFYLTPIQSPNFRLFHERQAALSWLNEGESAERQIT